MRLITLLIISSASINSFANDEVVPNQCKIISPYMTPENLPQLTLVNDRISVMSDNANIQYPNLLNYNGNVVFQQNDKFIRADTARYDQSNNLFTASGNLHFQDNSLTLTSDSLTTSLDGKDTKLSKNKYWFNNSMIHGSSKSFQVDSNKNLILTNAVFTTCPSDTPDWALHAQKIAIDTSSSWATVSNATLEIFEVPIFYFPYLKLPIADKRSTGFLYPSIGSSSDNGLEISTPYYWNIAENYDMTLTPRLMTERGLQLNTEFRYLNNKQQGLLNVEYLHDDKKTDDSRYLLYWQHIGAFDENWRITANLTQVSDDNYFNEIGSTYGNKTDNQLVKNVDLGYYTDDWWLNVRAQDIQILGHQTTPYKLLPQLSFHSYSNPINDYLEYDIFSELSYFQRNDEYDEKVSRLHIEPTIRLPINYASTNIIAEVKLMQTWYEQDNGIEDNSISRTLPQFKLHAEVDFERNLNSGLIQTLTPKFQYLFVPYKQQQDIGIYDTALLRDDYSGLFRERRFSGLDRIVDTNQVTLGVTTMIKDANSNPLFEASIGQTFYLERSQFFDNQTFIENLFPDRSALAGELSYILGKNWEINHSLQLNEQQNAVTQSKTTMDYRLSDNKLIQLTHRYVKDINDDKINQLGMQTVWPINQEWSFVGNYYRDTNLHRTIETFVGLQYESCCWSIRLQAYRQLEAFYDDNSLNSSLNNSLNTEKFDTGFSFSFQIKGLGTNKSSNASDMLGDGLFAYRRPYYLKN